MILVRTIINLIRRHKTCSVKLQPGSLKLTYDYSKNPSEKNKNWINEHHFISTTMINDYYQYQITISIIND